MSASGIPTRFNHPRVGAQTPRTPREVWKEGGKPGQSSIYSRRVRRSGRRGPEIKSPCPSKGRVSWAEICGDPLRCPLRSTRAAWPLVGPLAAGSDLPPVAVMDAGEGVSRAQGHTPPPPPSLPSRCLSRAHLCVSYDCSRACCRRGSKMAVSACSALQQR